MEKAKLAIATMTLVRDQEEEELLRESLELLAVHDIPVYITDGGSPDNFLDFLKSFTSFHVAPAPAKGLTAQVSNSIREARKSGREFILYTEPDKKNFFRMLDEFLENAGSEDAIFIAARSENGFNSYPAFQRRSETAINFCCAEITGADLDFTYGPFLIHRDIAPYLDLVTEDLGWGWRTYMFGIPTRLGKTIAEYRGEFLCPPEQGIDSAAERIYRIKQLEQSVRGIIRSTSIDLPE